jgi:hypothetical protein
VEREKRLRFDEGVGQGRVFIEDTGRARGVEGVHTCARDTTQGEQHAVGNVFVSLSFIHLFSMVIGFFCSLPPEFESKSDHYTPF